MVYRGPRCPALVMDADSDEHRECRKKADGIVGFCTLCEKIFCSSHRLMEEHHCEQLDKYREQAFEANAAQLEKERTQVIRI